MKWPDLPMMLAVALGWAWITLSPLRAQAQSSATSSIRTEIFVDSRGDTIPANPAKLPFKLVDGYPEYKLGSGDFLDITTVEGAVRKSETVRIQTDGTVSFSVVNAVPLRDLTLSEATRVLKEALGLYIRTPQIQVFMKEYNSRSASVFGAINLNVGSEISGGRVGPGVYALRGRISALELIMQAGGPTPDARLSQVNLTRENRTYLIDLQRAVAEGDTRQNVILQDGDIIQVTGTQQADRRVAILGEVSEPGVANLTQQSNMLEAIAAANGFTTQAAPNRIRIIRTEDPNNPTIITVDANRILKGDLSQNIGLLDGDIIVVPQAYGWDLQELLAEISPIINFGGLISTAPVVTTNGYDIDLPNSNTGQTTTLVPTGTTLAPTTTTTPLAKPTANQRSTETEQQLLRQIQQNLMRTQAAETEK